MTLVLSLLLGVSAFAPETWFHVIGGNVSKEGAAALSRADAVRRVRLRGVRQAGAFRLAVATGGGAEIRGAAGMVRPHEGARLRVLSRRRRLEEVAGRRVGPVGVPQEVDRLRQVRRRRELHVGRLEGDARTRGAAARGRADRRANRVPAARRRLRRLAAGATGLLTRTAAGIPAAVLRS